MKNVQYNKENLNTLTGLPEWYSHVRVVFTALIVLMVVVPVVGCAHQKEETAVMPDFENQKPLWENKDNDNLNIGPAVSGRSKLAEKPLENPAVDNPTCSRGYCVVVPTGVQPDAEPNDYQLQSSDWWSSASSFDLSLSGLVWRDRGLYEIWWLDSERSFTDFTRYHEVKIKPRLPPHERKFYQSYKGY